MQTLTAYFRWAIAAFCFALLPACGGGGSDDPSASYVLQRLAIGETRVISDERLSIVMTGVNDARCPAAAQCITSGYVAVDLLVTLEGVGEQQVIVTLGSGARDSQATFGGFQFLLSRVDPYPVSGPVQPIEYRADISLVKL